MGKERGGGRGERPPGLAGFGGEIAVADQHRERSTGLHRGQLRPVPDEQQLRASDTRLLRERVQCEGAGEACFVHDHQLPRLKPPPLDVFGERVDPFLQRADGGGRAPKPMQFRPQCVNLGEPLRLFG